MRLIRIFCVCFLLTFSLINVFAIPPDLQAKFILKIVTYDKNFDRYGDVIKIGSTSKRFIMTLRKLKSIKIKGKKFSVDLLESPADVKNFSIIYVDKSKNSEAEAYSKEAELNGVLSFADDPNSLDNGLAVSFKTKGGKPKIVISKSNSKKQGANFAGNFLAVCEVK